MDSFGTMEDESLDNSMSVIASDAKEMSGTTADPAPSSSADPSDVKPGIFCILSKAVKELGLKWATQEEPTHNQLSGVGTPLWLNLTEIKEADNVPFLDFLVSLMGLFGPAVEGFAEQLTAAQKSSQAMQHFLPKRSSSAMATSHPCRPNQRSLLRILSPDSSPIWPDAIRFPSAKDPGPSWPWIQRPQRHHDLLNSKRKGKDLVNTRLCPKRPLLCPQATRSDPGANGNMFVLKTIVNSGPVPKAPSQSAAVIARKI